MKSLVALFYYLFYIGYAIYGFMLPVLYVISGYLSFLSEGDEYYLINQIMKISGLSLSFLVFISSLIWIFDMKHESARIFRRSTAIILLFSHIAIPLLWSDFTDDQAYSNQMVTVFIASLFGFGFLWICIFLHHRFLYDETVH